MTITISQHFVEAEMEYEEDGKRPSGYLALNVTGKGKPIAKVTGPIEVIESGYGPMVRLDGGDYALRDILALARRGERGLAIIS